MGNWNGLIGPLTTLPSSHLFLRAVLLLRLIASQITQSNFVPFASDCGHFCSLTDANEQGGLVQPGWRLQPQHKQHKSTEPSNINQCSKPFVAISSSVEKMCGLKWWGDKVWNKCKQHVYCLTPQYEGTKLYNIVLILNLCILFTNVRLFTAIKGENDFIGWVKTVALIRLCSLLSVLVWLHAGSPILFPEVIIVSG